MSYTFVVRPAEREAFVRCRRQWDFGAWVRRRLALANSTLHQGDTPHGDERRLERKETPTGPPPYQYGSSVFS